MPYHCRDPKRDHNLDNHPYVLLLLYGMLTILADGLQSCSPVTMLVIVSIIVFALVALPTVVSAFFLTAPQLPLLLLPPPTLVPVPVLQPVRVLILVRVLGLFLALEIYT